MVGDTLDKRKGTLVFHAWHKGGGREKCSFEGVCTWAHIESRSASIVLGTVIGGGQTEVSQLDSVAMVGDQDVLRLQIPVVNSKLMAVLHGIQDLEEDLLGKFILTHIPTTLRDIQEEVALGAILQNNIDAVGIIHNLKHRHHILMG